MSIGLPGPRLAVWIVPTSPRIGVSSVYSVPIEAALRVPP